MTSYTIEIDRQVACYDWPLGECKHGEECAREHHSNLDPALGNNNDNYKVPNELNAACQRCMQRMYQASSKSIKCFSFANNA